MSFRLRTPKVSDIAHKRVLVRVDFNVPLQKFPGGWRVSNDNRIKAALETINFLITHQAKVVLISHLGRPDGQIQPELSLQPVAHHLSKLLHHPVQFAEKCVGSEVIKTVAALQPGEVILLENLRFHPEEEANQAAFTKQLACLGDVFINEAFSTAHRAHASTVGLTKYMPSFAGSAFAQEVETLHSLMTKPKRPFVMIIGGAKISDKVEAVVNLTQIADQVLVGGGVANNFLKAEGIEIAKSFVQDAPSDLKKKGVDYVAVAEHLLTETKPDRQLLDSYIPLPKIVYPIDVRAGSGPAATTSHLIELTEPKPDGLQATDMYLDIGPKTAHLYSELIMKAGTVFWNGPMGVFENPEFSEGTKKVAQALAKTKAKTILGGGDTQAAIEKYHLGQAFDYISTAGGAALELLAGKDLPGVQPLLQH